MIMCKKFFSSCLLFLVSTIFILFAMQTSVYAREDRNDTGKISFEHYCAVCHGLKGDAKGQLCYIRDYEKGGQKIVNYARDFTVGVFKFRTTSTGCLPTNNDLISIIENGFAARGAYMPPFKDLNSDTKRFLVNYIKTFSPRWEEEEPCSPIMVRKPEWVGKPASVERGKQVYKEMKCWECHGYEGKGDGPKSKELKDDRGRLIIPFDFTAGELKRGTSPENIYITFTTGLDGTGMPSYEDSLNEEDRWHLVSYTLKLMNIAK